jgi:hypothetical protein
MMGRIAIYALPIIFMILFAFYTKHQLIDEDDGPGWTKSETIWHRAGLGMRILLMGIGGAWVYVPAPSPAYLFHSAAIGALVFDVALNLFRGKGFFYVGSKTGKGWDAAVGKWKWLIYFILISFTTLFVIAS